MLGEIEADDVQLAQIDVWAWQMSSVHLILFELLERAYAFAPYAEANNDLESYLGFAEIALYHVCEHHEGEGEADGMIGSAAEADPEQKRCSTHA